MVVCGDVWWFWFFPGGLWWFAVICGNLWWFVFVIPLSRPDSVTPAGSVIFLSTLVPGSGSLNRLV